MSMRHHPRADPAVREQLAGWMPRQRWFSHKGHAPRLEAIAALPMPGSADAEIITYFMIDHEPAEPVLYQLPISIRRSELPGGAHALIGTAVDDRGTLHLYDAPHDPDYVRTLLDMMAEESAHSGEGVSMRGVRLTARPERFRLASSTVHAGEQSNTSIICRSADDPEVRLVCKIYRALHHGENPDVVLQSALSQAGSPHVPRSFGAVTGSWPDTGRHDDATGHLAFVQEFVTGARDGWALALRMAEAGEDFTDHSHHIGAAVAEVHSRLAATFPAPQPSPADLDQVIGSWSRRLESAVSAAPQLAEFVDDIREIHRRVRGEHWPTMQRVHGDLHLGQLIIGSDHRWRILDFEGEPMRPMIERAVPDFALRDVAGMLRSFDYIPGSLADSPGVREWADAARDAFLASYRAELGCELDEGLLIAFELDKALYEVVYEAHNRPDWVRIPLAAVERLVGLCTRRAEG